MSTIKPCLWFDGKAEEAIRFYGTVFPDLQIQDTVLTTEAGPGEPGRVLVITFRLQNQDFMALNGGPMYQFTPAVSMMVTCDTQEEVDATWDKLLDGGTPNACGWLQDRFGLSWQIVPKGMPEIFAGPDKAGAARAMKAMMGMIKLDIAEVRRAYEGR